MYSAGFLPGVIFGTTGEQDPKYSTMFWAVLKVSPVIWCRISGFRFLARRVVFFTLGNVREIGLEGSGVLSLHLGFRVQVLGFRVQGSGFRVQG